jgi:hypothetical protein
MRRTRRRKMIFLVLRHRVHSMRPVRQSSGKSSRRQFHFFLRVFLNFKFLYGNMPWNLRRFLIPFDAILSSGQPSPLAVACEEVGSVPTYETTQIIMFDNVRLSNLHDEVQKCTHTGLWSSPHPYRYP